MYDGHLNHKAKKRHVDMGGEECTGTKSAQGAIMLVKEVVGKKVD